MYSNKCLFHLLNLQLHILILLFLLLLSSSLLAVMYSALVSMSYQFLGATPDHWCRVESLKEANWTDQQILDLAIPFK